MKSINNSTSTSKGGRQYVKTGINHGGSRKGSGRKASACTLKTREIVDRALSDGGLTPLAYMLEVLRESLEIVEAQYKSGAIDKIEYAIKIESIEERRYKMAKTAAPYMHPKYSSVKADIVSNGQDQWAQILSDFEAES